MINVKDYVTKNEYKSVRDHKVYDERLKEALKEVEQLKRERDILLGKINTDMTNVKTIDIDEDT